jgi:predicted HicB family RNase H-like nuclease
MGAMIYRGYSARADYNAEDRLFIGRLAGINDLVSFHGQSVDELEAAFREAVDDYIAVCVTVGRAPESPPAP